jgi:genome maintenance exonuclease 1
MCGKASMRALNLSTPMNATAVVAVKVLEFNLYNPKFDYQPIPRVTVDGKRFYATPDGNKLPSVTTILDKTKSEESKAALHNWRRAVGAERAQAITTEAANRGTRMHTYLEKYIREGAIPARGSNPFSWPSHIMAEEVVNKGLKNVSEFWGIEVPLYFPSVYAGTTDGAGIHLNEESILDYKQTNKPKKREWIDDYFVQLCAYAEAHNELHGTRIKKGVILMCVKPNLDEQHNIIGKPQYQEFVLEGAEFEKYRTLWWKKVEQFYMLNM